MGFPFGWYIDRIEVIVMAVCPYCNDPITRVDIAGVTLQAGLNLFSGLVYSCPACDKVLSVGYDPKVQQDRIVESVVEAMRRA